ncbi:hypothetical protein ACHHYP_10988 [Achlya hypogyna]|uniref:Tyrosine specific protein phosphatases domain-containing protein n=1 Tax=Achlya hypogyna TaxID=1202772 RepID=A0A1V9YK39_ACHHY|nr:hypothetical protein ACHHYP_10988 [Achlya hypogyna]
MTSPPRPPTRPLLPIAGTVGPREWEKSLTIKCRFCGGPKCKRCSEHAALLKTDSPVTGLHADWVTESILGMMRPSSRLMQTYRIAEQFTHLKIKAVFNLTMPGEHPHCGDGNGISGFPYDPEMDLMAHQIQFYNFGWEDMTSPSLALMLDIVTVMASILAHGQQKVAVHCHAGYGDLSCFGQTDIASLGRTGLAIACTLAIGIVRRGRPGSIQTHGQVAFVGRFHDYLRQAKLVFALPTIHDRFSLQTILERERLQFHPTPPTTSMILPPRIVSYLCKLLEAWALKDVDAVCIAFVGHVPHTTYTISLQPHLQLLLGNYTESVDTWRDFCVTSDELLPIKAQMNSGEPNWPRPDAAFDKPVFAGLLLDWLEHLNPPLVEPNLLSDIAALDKAPLATLRTIERILETLRLCKTQLETATTKYRVVSSATEILDALYARAAMALTQVPSLRSRSLIPAIRALVELNWSSPSPLQFGRHLDSVASDAKNENDEVIRTIPRGSGKSLLVEKAPVSPAKDSPPKHLEKLPRRPRDVGMEMPKDEKSDRDVGGVAPTTIK